MTLTIYAIDEQFAVATGSNVNNAPGMSTFDYPPNSTKDLVIQSHPGDPSPYVFSPGDVYTVSYGGHGGGETLLNATVIRSDAVSYNGDTGFAVVFQGQNELGETVQVVWTPDFDLEAWYWANFHAGSPPGFYTTDLSAPTTYQLACFEQATPIETESGLRPVSDLRAGDRVMTRDHGPQELRWVLRLRVDGQTRGAPVWFETGAIGNDVPLRLSRQHRVLLKDPRGGEVLVPAIALVNGATIRQVPQDRVTYLHLLFDRHEIVTAAGAPCESLLFTEDSALATLSRPALGLTPALSRLARTPCRPLLGARQGKALWARICQAGGRTPPVFGRRGHRHSRAFVFEPRETGNCRAVAARMAQGDIPLPLRQPGPIIPGPLP